MAELPGESNSRCSQRIGGTSTWKIRCEAPGPAEGRVDEESSGAADHELLRCGELTNAKGCAVSQILLDPQVEEPKCGLGLEAAYRQKVADKMARQSGAIDGMNTRVKLRSLPSDGICERNVGNQSEPLQVSASRALA